MKQLGTLLLVDDDRHVLASMADWLRDQGYATDTAASLAEGLRRRGSEVLRPRAGRHPLRRRRRLRPAGPLPQEPSGHRRDHDYGLRHGGRGGRGHPPRGLRFPDQAVDRRRAARGHRTGAQPAKGHRREQDPQGPARLAVRHGEHRGPRPPHAEGLRRDRRRGRHAGHRVDDRRERHGQVADRPGHPSPQRAARHAVRGSRLRSAAGDAAGKRTVRPRGRAPSPARSARSSASSSSPTRGRSSSTKSAPPAPPCR